MNRSRAQAWMDVSRQLKRALDEGLAEKDLSAIQFGLLVALHHQSGPLTAADLARHLGKDKPTVGGLVKRLKKSGWVLESPHAEDKRARVLFLSARAKKELPSLMNLAKEVEEDFFSVLSQDERQVLTRCLERLKEERK